MQDDNEGIYTVHPYCTFSYPLKRRAALSTHSPFSVTCVPVLKFSMDLPDYQIDLLHRWCHYHILSEIKQFILDSTFV